jgi:hypothetical protein
MLTGTVSASECPPWCAITDHQTVDGGKGLHASDGQDVSLRLYPFVCAESEEHDFAHIMVGLQIDRAALQPYVQMVVDDVQEVRLTVLDAEELGFALLEEAAKWRRSEDEEAMERHEALAARALGDDR